jgi:hemoglobin
MRTRAFFLALLVASGLIAFACGGNKKPPPKEPTIVETVADAGPDAPEEAEAPPQKSLFERLGGKEGIAKVIDALIKRLTADAKIQKRFAGLKGAKLDKFKAALADQICEEAGGPDCKYGGKPMKDAHSKMKIKEEEWQAFLIDLKGALEDAKVGENEQGDVMSTLSKFHDDIVDPKTKPKK